MSDKVRIQYNLGQHGWSRFQLVVGATSVVVGPFGYCTDALGDLVRAALMIATSASRAEVSLDAEPMEWRLVAGPYWNPTQSSWTDFRLRVLTFQYLANPPSPDAEGICLLEAQCSPEDFARAVLEAAQAIWDEYGADGYDKAWGGPCGFPLRALHALKTAMSVPEPRTGWLNSSS
ncbi:hypothetical protein IC762_28065 [Bradyrhizobium genosp. L]|uniref:hypothetical protein n=1 Tax=Bradyrhizobium genosp. L TaxID=83637 RepID=UPI0018A2C78C|nr:hypothetical protein [Bradyrhizobium genosp. L]QPF83529.1 hypothetical protein IC762_28065 [Bradyrhizobium genosp. L]